jgi:DNA-binding NarL/FixJ family response regulator
VLASEHESGHVEAAIKAGAAAYVHKSVSPEDLAAAVRRIFLRSIVNAPSTGPRAPRFQPTTFLPPAHCRWTLACDRSLADTIRPPTA